MFINLYENIDLVTIGKQLSETLETIESRLSDITERLNKLETQGSMVRTGPPGPRGPKGKTDKLSDIGDINGDGQHNILDVVANTEGNGGGLLEAILEAQENVAISPDLNLDNQPF